VGGAVKLADFGLAQIIQRTGGGSAREGTPGYLSGAGGLVGVARRLHRVTLGKRPFIHFRVHLVASIDSTKPVADLAAMLSRIAMLTIPPVSERSDEVAHLLEAYAMDVAVELGTDWLGLMRGDPERMLDSGAATHDELEAFARRFVALRNSN